jgi:predicted O-methyltransferase YrrM
MFLLKAFIQWFKNLVRPLTTHKLSTSEPFHFTANWFENYHDQHLSRLLEPYKNKAKVKYLEIGIYEGRSLFWMLQNILTHPTSSATTIDLRHRPQTLTFRQNLKKSGYAKRVQTLWGRSEDLLRTLPKNHFDIIYVDGDHDARGVMIDAIHSWHVLKYGGILIFDDYKMMSESFPADLRPQLAIDAFLEAFRSELEVLMHDYQVIVRKKTQGRLRFNGESQIGPYVYNWYGKKLYKVHFGQKYLRRQIQISQEQQRSLELMLNQSSDSPLGSSEGG